MGLVDDGVDLHAARLPHRQRLACVRKRQSRAGKVKPRERVEIDRREPRERRRTSELSDLCGSDGEDGPDRGVERLGRLPPERQSARVAGSVDDRQISLRHLCVKGRRGGGSESRQGGEESVGEAEETDLLAGRLGGDGTNLADLGHHNEHVCRARNRQKISC